jgi:hypothetical protein
MNDILYVIMTFVVTLIGLSNFIMYQTIKDMNDEIFFYYLDKNGVSIMLFLRSNFNLFVRGVIMFLFAWAGELWLVIMMGLSLYYTHETRTKVQGLIE